MKEKVFKKGNYLIQWENNIKTVSEEFFSSENIEVVRFWCMIIIVVDDGWSILSRVSPQIIKNCWIFSRNCFISNNQPEWLSKKQKIWRSI